MSKEPFDPFDEKHRDPVKRRKPSEVAFEKKEYENRIDSHFKRALDCFGNPKYVSSESILDFFLSDEDRSLDWFVLRRNLKASFARLGYAKVVNEKAKSGLFNLAYCITCVYSRVSPENIDLNELKQTVG